jgi:MOSC domain-containing protein YiiM
MRDYDRLCLPFPSSCDQGKNMSGIVVAVARDAEHRFSKQLVSEISIIAGQGVEGDAHKGVTVKHRSRVKADPTQPNLRQVHLIPAELFDELTAKGFDVAPAQLGENITTRGIDLLALPKSALLKIGSDVVLEITGLRNPCSQIENFEKGLLGAVLDKTDDGELVRKAGIMSIVIAGGNVQAGDNIEVELPPLPHEKLERV